MTITLSHLALQDLENVRRYTIDRWGRDQWLKYFRGLSDTFETIAENPDRGRDRNLFCDGMRSVNYGKHVLFYLRIKTNQNQPVILRIVHQKQNLPALVYYEDLDG